MYAFVSPFKCTSGVNGVGAIRKGLHVKKCLKLAKSWFCSRSTMGQFPTTKWSHRSGIPRYRESGRQASVSGLL